MTVDERDEGVILEELLALARADAAVAGALQKRSDIDPDYLRRAYQYCADITRARAPRIYLATRLLPVRQRRAVDALLAVTCLTDDIVDGECLLTGGREQRRRRLRDWRERILASEPPEDSPVAQAWSDSRERLQLPIGHLHRYLQVQETELEHTPPADFRALAHYCYGIGATSALIGLRILGVQAPQLMRCVVALGVAMELTDVVCDVAQDGRRGLLYLPSAELVAFDLAGAGARYRASDDRWRALLRFQVARIRRLFERGRRELAAMPRRERLATSGVIALNLAVLDELQARDYDVSRPVTMNWPLRARAALRMARAARSAIR